MTESSLATTEVPMPSPTPTATPPRRRLSTKRVSMICLAAIAGPLAVAFTQFGPKSADQQPQADGVSVNVVLLVSVPNDQREELQAEFERQFSGFAEERGLLEVGVFSKPELTLWLEIIQPEVDSSSDAYVIRAAAFHHGKVDMEFYDTCLHCWPSEVVARGLMTNLAKATAAIEPRPTTDSSEEDYGNHGLWPGPPSK